MHARPSLRPSHPPLPPTVYSYDLIPHRTIEELKHRFYSATRKVISVRVQNPRLAAQIANSGLRSFAQFHFSPEHEHQVRCAACAM